MLVRDYCMKMGEEKVNFHISGIMKPCTQLFIADKCKPLGNLLCIESMKCTRNMYIEFFYDNYLCFFIILNFLLKMLLYGYTGYNLKIINNYYEKLRNYLRII